jgi:hypothetical protein
LIITVTQYFNCSEYLPDKETMNSHLSHFSSSTESPLPSQSSRLPRGAHGFDFFFGSWLVRNRRLKQRLAGSNEWEEFDATSECQPILGGTGNQDEFLSAYWPDFIGMSLRLFDPQTQQWSIYWISNQNMVLQPPVIGKFSGSEGIFDGPDEFNGKPIVVRYIWSRIDTSTPRWEQAFSSDQGKTWEINWIMDFQRANTSIGG